MALEHLRSVSGFSCVPIGLSGRFCAVLLPSPPRLPPSQRARCRHFPKLVFVQKLARNSDSYLFSHTRWPRLLSPSLKPLMPTHTAWAGVHGMAGGWRVVVAGIGAWPGLQGEAGGRQGEEMAGMGGGCRWVCRAWVAGADGGYW